MLKFIAYLTLPVLMPSQVSLYQLLLLVIQYQQHLLPPALPCRHLPQHGTHSQLQIVASFTPLEGTVKVLSTLFLMKHGLHWSLEVAKMKNLMFLLMLSQILSRTCS